METLAERLKRLIERAHIEVASLGIKAGIPADTIYKIIRSDRPNPRLSTLRKLAVALDVSLDELTGEPNMTEYARELRQRRISIVGDISCGAPMLATEHVEGYLTLPEDILPQGAVIALRIHGESMVDARLHDGDLALIKLQETAEDGDIAAVCVGDSREDATIKRLKYFDSFIALLPLTSDPEYLPLTVRSDQVHVVGRVVGVYWG